MTETVWGEFETATRGLATPFRQRFGTLYDANDNILIPSIHDYSLDDDRRDRLAALITASPALELACRAVLLFHAGGPWDEDRRLCWSNITGRAEATTKGLCDFVREVLARTDPTHLDNNRRPRAPKPAKPPEPTP